MNRRKQVATISVVTVLILMIIVFLAPVPIYSKAVIVPTSKTALACTLRAAPCSGAMQYSEATIHASCSIGYVIFSGLGYCESRDCLSENSDTLSELHASDYSVISSFTLNGNDYSIPLTFSNDARLINGTLYT